MKIRSFFIFLLNTFPPAGTVNTFARGGRNGYAAGTANTFPTPNTFSCGGRNGNAAGTANTFPTPNTFSRGGRNGYAAGTADIQDPVFAVPAVCIYRRVRRGKKIAVRTNCC